MFHSTILCTLTHFEYLIIEKKVDFRIVFQNIVNIFKTKNNIRKLLLTNLILTENFENFYFSFSIWLK